MATEDQPEERGPTEVDAAYVRMIGAAPPEVKTLAEKLAKAQNTKVEVTSEENGYQIYIPCPGCLEAYGEREINQPKYAINASMYLKVGKFREEIDMADARVFNPILGYGDDVNDDHDLKSSVCMRTYGSPDRHQYPVSMLLDMGTVMDRHPDLFTRARLVGNVADESRESYWEPHPLTPDGAPVPPAAGKLVPVHVLALTDPQHPVLEYIRLRRFEPTKLWEQFLACFCVEEYPRSDRKKIFYRRMPGGWKDTPQHRLIFHSMVEGVPLTWQGRFLEKTDEQGLNLYALNPYTLPFEWDHIATRPHVKSAWIPVLPFDQVDDTGSLRFRPAKYRTAKHSYRALMGWDAALSTAARAEGMSWCVLCEGPLDAARVGPGGIALIGKSINRERAGMVVRNFNLVFTAFDDDKPGREATASVAKMLSTDHRGSILQAVTPMPLPPGKDPGEADQDEFDELLARMIARAHRGM